MTEDCLFCKIASGDLPAHVIYEDSDVMAFLDIHPIQPGHSLVIPKAHHVWFEDIPARVAARVIECSQEIARDLKRQFSVERVGLMFTGIHVPHAHAHVVPMHGVHDLTSMAYLRDGPSEFSMPARSSDAELGRIAQTLRTA